MMDNGAFAWKYVGLAHMARYQTLISVVPLALLLGAATIRVQLAQGQPTEASLGPEESTGAGPLLPTCQPRDFHYALTECDENGSRWRVQVPLPDTCTGGAPAPPERAKDCGYSCGPGEFLDISSGDCMKCPPGKYSLGGGVKFTDWSELPPEFSVSSSAYYLSEAEDACNASLWEPIGNFIRSPSDTCSSKLIYTATLAREGSVNFTYSLATDMNYFTVAVHNKLCQSTEFGSGAKPVTSTGEGQWRSVKLDLSAGLNVITWKSEGLFLGTSFKIPTIYIRSIEVMGLQFTSECTPCPAGTVSAAHGASRCDECAANTFSHAGAANCSECNQATEYSVPGSSTCTLRKPCVDHDYYKMHTPCNAQNQTRVMYKWIEPQLCNANDHSSVRLPASGDFEPCPPCNPGMSIENRTDCDFCPLNQFSDGMHPCEECPPNTTPEYGMVFSYWNSLPPNMRASCITTTDDYGCASSTGWVLLDTYIHTAHGHSDDAYLVLDLQVDGFTAAESYSEEGRAQELGTVTFVFSMECESADCTLFFLEEINDISIINYWIGSRDKMEYRYAVTSAGERTFSWAFQKTDVTKLDVKDNYRYPNDIVKIYDITVTNTLNGGATSCKECPLGSDHSGCIPCKPGQYIDEKSKRCKQCPEDTVVRVSDPVGESACIKCPFGLKSQQGQTCYSNCHVNLNGNHYDLTALQGQKSVMSGASFLTEGNAFYYHYNFSLCGKEQNNLASCAENSTVIGEEPDLEDEVVHSWVCRTIMLPDPDHSNSMTSMKPVSLGDTLLGINDRDRLGDVNDTIIPQPTSGLPDLKFYYHSTLTTKACPKGRSTIVTLRCDPNEKSTNTIELPTSCPTVVQSDQKATVAQAGTCDGCTFHMLWTSKYACPLCKEEDVVSITQVCKNGQQVTTYVWNDTVQCVGGMALPGERTEACVEPEWYSQMPMYVQIIIISFVSCAILLCCMVVYIWKKNRKLEYKYQKLVSSASGELPAADSCAIEDGEDDDEVQFEDGKKKKTSSFLHKFKPSRGSDKQGLLDGADMEAFRMKDQPSIMTPLAEST